MALTIDAIRNHIDTEPVDVLTGVRTLPPKAERTGKGWGGTIVRRGKPDFTDPTAENFYRGTWNEDPAGTEVSIACDGWPGPDDDGYTELLTTMSAGLAGAEVDRTDIDYTTASGKKYTLVVELDFVMCGNRTRDPDCR